MLKPQIYHREATPSSGSVSFNTHHISGEILSIHVKPTTATTSYKINIVGKNGLKIWESETDGVGEIGEIGQTIMNRVVDEVCTVAISSSTVDEVFDIEIRVRGYTSER